jgi:PAS domain S-box-containing protein
MSTPDGALQEARRPLLSSNLWVPLLLILVACLAIVYYGHQVAKTLEQSVAASARAQGQATAHEISGFVRREHERLHAFVEEKQDEVRSILAYPDNWPAIDALQTSVQRLFRGAFAFAVTDPDGKPLFEDFEGLVGAVCQASMRDYAQAVDQGQASIDIPPIHPVPDAYHFDLISPWRLDGGKSGLFFISMSPNRIAELIAAAEKASGMRILLVNRDEPSLIEVAAGGARDALQGDFRIEPDELVPGHYSTDLPGTRWRLLVLPNREALGADLRTVYVKVAALVMALLLISVALLYGIRRAEQRNSSLFMRSLQTSVSRQRAILQSMVDGLITIDANGTIHHVNNAITRLFGYQPKDLIGGNVAMLMPEPTRSAHDGYLEKYLKTGEATLVGKGREVTARRKDGSLFPVLFTLGESFEGDERMFVGILHDLTAYKEAQRQIVAQNMAIKRSREELDEISKIASQDLQLPLQRIASLGESLEASALSGSEKAQLKTLANEARDVSERVKGLADYARAPREPRAEAVDLNAVLKDVQKDLSALIKTTGAEIVVHPLGKAIGDPAQLRQVFWNLIENAIKFRDPTRKPQISVSLDEAAAGGDALEEPQLTVRVSDNGIGIPEDQLQAVFEAFRRLHPRDAYPGAGLGLSLCRKIVEGIGGTIGVSSTPGKGSTFRVTLPRTT